MQGAACCLLSGKAAQARAEWMVELGFRPEEGAGMIMDGWVPGISRPDAPSAQFLLTFFVFLALSCDLTFLNTLRSSTISPDFSQNKVLLWFVGHLAQFPRYFPLSPNPRLSKIGVSEAGRVAAAGIACDASVTQRLSPGPPSPCGLQSHPPGPFLWFAQYHCSHGIPRAP